MFDVRDAESDKRDAINISLGDHLRELEINFKSNHRVSDSQNSRTINPFNLKFATQ